MEKANTPPSLRPPWSKHTPSRFGRSQPLNPTALSLKPRENASLPFPAMPSLNGALPRTSNQNLALDNPAALTCCAEVKRRREANSRAFAHLELAKSSRPAIALDKRAHCARISNPQLDGGQTGREGATY